MPRWRRKREREKKRRRLQLFVPRCSTRISTFECLSVALQFCTRSVPFKLWNRVQRSPRAAVHVAHVTREAPYSCNTGQRLSLTVWPQTEQYPCLWLTLLPEMPSHPVVCDRRRVSETYWAEWTPRLKCDRVQNTQTVQTGHLCHADGSSWLIIIWRRKMHEHLLDSPERTTPSIPNKKSARFKHVVQDSFSPKVLENTKYGSVNVPGEPVLPYSLSWIFYRRQQRCQRSSERSRERPTQSLREKHSSILCASCYA